MALNVDEKWVRDFCARTGQKLPEELNSKGGANGILYAQIAMPEDETGGRRKMKYGNQSTEADGMKFASRHEAKTYEDLRLECLAGKHIGLGCQVAFYLPGGIKYVADFVTLEADGTFTVYDAKSEATKMDKTYRLKKRQMKNCLGIKIREV